MVRLALFLLLAIIAKNPLDVSGMDPSLAGRYLKGLINHELEIEGVVKDADSFKTLGLHVIYEIPAYRKDGSGYVKYGIVCQEKGQSTIIFADEGYLSSFVKTNVVDKPVLAKGRLVDGGQITGLPRGLIFIIDSLRLEDGGGD